MIIKNRSTRAFCTVFSPLHTSPQVESTFNDRVTNRQKRIFKSVQRLKWHANETDSNAPKDKAKTKEYNNNNNRINIQLVGWPLVFRTLTYSRPQGARTNISHKIMLNNRKIVFPFNF